MNLTFALRTVPCAAALALGLCTPLQAMGGGTGFAADAAIERELTVRPAPGHTVTDAVAALKQAGLVPSTSEALRMIEGGGVRIDGEKVSDKGLVFAAGSTIVLQVGKRKFARVSLA